MIVIIDYGLGNLKSVLGAVQRLGYEVVISHSVDDLEEAEKLILPGVGAFGDGIRNLKDINLIDPLNELVLKRKKPVLAICLGFQLLAEESLEFGHNKGLGWINATVEKINPDGEDIRIPHVGWNDLFVKNESILWEDVPAGTLFYYTHSFHVKCKDQDIVIGMCKYGIDFVAAIQQQNIYATQFHPEKSQYYGLCVLKNFLEKA